MLTGKADEQTAVQAFNAKIIDRFIRKHDSDAMRLVNDAIAELQQEYFDDMGQMLSHALSVGSHAFLRDPAFVLRIQEVKQKLGIVEHYLTCAPHGLLMLDAVGTTYLLLVQDTSSVQEVYEIAYDQNAPDELLKKLRSGQYLPYFWKTEGHYAPIYSDWQSCLHPANQCQGKDHYLYTLIKDPEGFNRTYLSSYNDYLQQLDLEILKQPLGAT